jgi:hypothetical protein
MPGSMQLWCSPPSGSESGVSWGPGIETQTPVAAKSSGSGCSARRRGPCPRTEHACPTRHRSPASEVKKTATDAAVVTRLDFAREFLSSLAAGLDPGAVPAPAGGGCRGTGDMRADAGAPDDVFGACTQPTVVDARGTRSHPAAIGAGRDFANRTPARVGHGSGRSDRPRRRTGRPRVRRLRRLLRDARAALRPGKPAGDLPHGHLLADGCGSAAGSGHTSARAPSQTRAGLRS